MDVSISKVGKRVKVAVVGTIDTATAPELFDALASLDYDGLELTVDFNKTDYITSAGLRALLVARKKIQNGRMRIVGVNDEIEQVFKMTGFDTMLQYKKKSTLSEDSFRMSFKALLAKRAAENPDDTAFVYLGREYSWACVDKASQIIASDLASAGVRKGSHVGICAPNSQNWIFAFFAVQKLGAISVFLNYGLTPNELSALVSSADISHICFGEIPGVTEYASYIGALSSVCKNKIYTLDISPRVDVTKRFIEYDAVKDKFSEMFHSDDASVVIFSSGSTGLPKAILSSSYNLLKCILPLIEEYGICREDRNCAFLPFFHVFGFATCISAGLLVGYVSYIPESVKASVILDDIYKYKCTLFQTVPTMMLAIVAQSNFTPEKVSSLRVSLLGGAATTEAQMNMLRSIMPNDHFGNIYGMSENAAISVTGYEDTVYHITKTAGKPVKDVFVEIRNPLTKEKLSCGTVGEIYVRSDSMVVCYYKLPLEKQPLDDEGWLSTGDLGMIDEDGYLIITGRVKDLIIRGGENISPGEIAEAICKIEAVADTKVIGVPSELLGEEVAAAIIMKDGYSFDEVKAKEILSSQLSGYKVPAYFLTFDSFPLLGSGKVDTIKLKKEVADRIEREGLRQKIKI